MLVLTRKVGESLVIDGEIVVQVLEIQGGRIRLGMDAPIDVSIRREEIPSQLPAREQSTSAS